MRLYTKPYSDQFVGNTGTPFQSFDEFLDLEILLSIKNEDQIPLLSGRDWTQIGKRYYSNLVEGNALPLFKSVWEQDDFFTYGGHENLKDLHLNIYTIDPIDNFRFFIEIFVEDIIQDAHLFKYICRGLRFLVGNTCWEKDFRNGLYISALPEMDNVPMIIVKQDNNGTTFVISPIKLENLEYYKPVRV